MLLSYMLLASVSQACMYRSLPGQQKAQRCADCVSLVFSSAACSAAGWQLLSYAWEGTDAGQHAMEHATKVVCIAAGFFAFRLWTLVHRCEHSSVTRGCNTSILQDMTGNDHQVVEEA